MFFKKAIKDYEFFLKAGSTAPLFIDQPEEPESNATDGIELFEDSQLNSRSKAIASKTKEIEQVKNPVSLGCIIFCSYHFAYGIYSK